MQDGQVRLSNGKEVFIYLNGGIYWEKVVFMIISHDYLKFSMDGTFYGLNYISGNRQIMWLFCHL